MSSRISHSPAHEGADLIPVRMCNELVFCPRLFHLEHVQGFFVDSPDTVEGRAEHERAEKRGRLRKRDDSGDDLPSWLRTGLRRKITLESAALGVRGTVDLLEIRDDQVIVVEAKHGRSPRESGATWRDHTLSFRAWPADLAQIGLYMALLRESGVPCDEGRVYYRKDRHSSEVLWSDDLERFILEVVRSAREVARMAQAPAPLDHSGKCFGCSLNGVCLPDEHRLLAGLDQPEDVRRIVPGRDDRAVLHVMSPGTVLRKEGEAVRADFRNGDPSERVLFKDLSQVALYGRSMITEPCLQALLAKQIPIAHHTGAGRLIGITQPLTTRNVQLRQAQYRAVDNDDMRLSVARALVVSKLRNQKTMVRRYRARGDGETASPQVADTLNQLAVAVRNAKSTDDIDTLRGFEGSGAAAYFACLPELVPASWRADFSGRSRRPPRDRINAMLGFGYALLVRDATAALGRIGLDPMLGLFHTMIAGRPALSLDIMEPFRPAWVDAAVLRLLATNGISRDDFQVSGTGVFLSEPGRKTFIRAYERRGDELTTHPRFGYRMSYRRILELEARVLAKFLVGEIDTFEPLVTR